MRCWVDKDEFWPWYSVWTADAPSWADTADIPLKVIRRYEKAREEFEVAHAEFKAAFDESRGAV